MAFWNKEKPKAQTIAEPDPTPVEATPTVLETVPVVAAPSIPAPMPQEIPPAKPKKKPKSAPKRKRPFDAHIWFSEAEQRKLERRVEQSGLSKGVFIRKAALENPIVIDPKKEKLLSAVTKMTAELKYIHKTLAGGRRGLGGTPNRPWVGKEFSSLRDPVLPFVPTESKIKYKIDYNRVSCEGG